MRAFCRTANESGDRDVLIYFLRYQQTHAFCIITFLFVALFKLEHIYTCSTLFQCWFMWPIHVFGIHIHACSIHRTADVIESKTYVHKTRLCHCYCVYIVIVMILSQFSVTTSKHHLRNNGFVAFSFCLYLKTVNLFSLIR